MSDPAPAVRKRNALGASGGFDAATTGRRGKGWTPPRLGRNTIFGIYGDTIVARSRDAFRNSGWASATLDSFCANAVATGVQMVSKHPEIAELWKQWCKQCDAEHDPNVFGSGTHFEGQQQVAVREMFEAGEVFVRVHHRRARRPARRPLRVPMQIELLQAEQLPLWQTTATQVAEGNTLRSGIEFDKEGRRVAYHFYKVHPGETGLFPGQGFQLERIPAEYVVHVFKPLQAGQLRGRPFLTSVLAKLNEIEKLADAELVRRATASMLTGFIKRAPGAGVDVPLNPDENQPAGDVGAAVSSLEPGSFPVLDVDEDVVLAKPPEATDFAPTMRKFLEAFAVGAGCTYEQTTGDLVGVTYSSIRAGLVEFRRKIEQFQYATFVHKFLQPVFQHFLYAAVLSGALVLDGYDDHPEQFEDVEWVMPGFDWVDPLKDVEAELVSIQAGLNSRRTSAATRGYNVEQIDAENAQDRQREQNLNLKYSSDPSLAAPSRAAVDEQNSEDRNQQ